MTAPFDNPHNTPQNSYETLTWVRTEAGAVPVYTRDPEGLTPLIRAARDGDTALLRRLISDGAKLEERDNVGWTALHWAVKSRQLKATAELIAAGADTEAEARNGLTPLSVAVKTGNPAIISLLAGIGGAGK